MQQQRQKGNDCIASLVLRTDLLRAAMVVSCEL